jgi:hypothetical protein
MRPLLFLALAVLLAVPASAQTPPPETITFEGLGTPIPYAVGATVPDTARLKQVTLAGGGIVRFRTRGGASYAALVSHFGTTGIVGVSKKGKIEPERRLLEIRIRKVKRAAFDSFAAIQAGARVDTKGTADTSDDETFYDAAGAASLFFYDLRGDRYPIDGSSLVLVRSGADPQNLVKESYDMTTTSLDFPRILIAGTVVYDDFVVSYGH